MVDASVTPTLDDFVSAARCFLDGVCADGAHARVNSTKSRYALFSGSTTEEVSAAVDYQRAAFDAGFGWITGPTEYGGAGLSVKHEHAFAAAEREYAIPPKGPLAVSLGMVAPTLTQFGSEECKRRWLRDLRRGDIVGCQLFSEPAAGSDLAAVHTRAHRAPEGGDWTLNGQKVWTSGAHYSDIGIALTRTSEGPRHRLT
jgi:alkylation response protein AidB-like acyl-CoA dehydrogenase